MYLQLSALARILLMKCFCYKYVTNLAASSEHTHHTDFLHFKAFLQHKTHPSLGLQCCALYINDTFCDIVLLAADFHKGNTKM